MKNKKALVFGTMITILSIVIVSLIIQHNQYNGRTLLSREKVLNKRENGLKILSETSIDNYIVSQIVSLRGRYGYALFQLKGRGNYSFQSSMLSEESSIITDFLWIGGKGYEIFMCNQPELDYVEVSYTDSRDLKVTTKILDLIEGRIAITEAPNLKSYERDVVFYDINGNKYK